ncbi:general transcription factor IIH subunit 2-like [Actinia tenebrosa]|uniref:General transcription factor IIH subunit 2-like n=1 Tax=Actinia tenebrosa TaxID=6105 RepID=A0A6P8J4X2_ACTTE|nr:general transcription factor IIH subunit 2-like [Actinia tenebrosa]
MADEEEGYRWLNEYEKTWEEIREDNEGSLQSLVDELIHRNKRKRAFSRPGNVRLGMMRHMYLIIDMSKAMEEADLKPTRLNCTVKLLENFITEYFDQNPISQIGIILTRNKRAEKLTELSGNPKLHIKALQKACLPKMCQGEPSLQNSLLVAANSLRNSRFLCQSLLQSVVEQNIRCSIIGLAAEMRVCKTICNKTQGKYKVILDEKHYKDLLMEQVTPPAAKADTEAALIRMGFPQHMVKGPPSLCMCHLDNDYSTKGLNTRGFFCPQCKSKYCDLPVECKVCGLTLVSAPHLARSYQHLFPFPQYIEEHLTISTEVRKCQACQIILREKSASTCTKCQQTFCLDCDAYIHESLHACPGCVAKEISQCIDL